MLCGAKLHFFYLFSFIYSLGTAILDKREKREEKSEENKKGTAIFFRKLPFLFGAAEGIKTKIPRAFLRQSAFAGLFF